MMKKNLISLTKKIILLTLIVDANTFCTFIFGQEQAPETLKKLRKF